MPLNFPSSPTLNQTFVGGGRTYRWDGEKWINITAIVDGLVGPAGPEGPAGPAPAHGWSSTSLRFQNPNGTWGTYVNLKGDPGEQGPAGVESYPRMTKDDLGVAKLGIDTVQTTAPNTPSTNSSRTYPIQVLSDDRLVVNVPWVNTNTTYSEISEDDINNGTTNLRTITGRRAQYIISQASGGSINASNINEGTLSVAHGGTGRGTFTSGEVLIGNGTGGINTLSRFGIDSRTAFPPASHNHTGTYVPVQRILTINGQSHSLTENRSWTVATGEPNSVKNWTNTLTLNEGTTATTSASLTENIVDGGMYGIEFSTINNLNTQRNIAFIVAGSIGTTTSIYIKLNLGGYHTVTGDDNRLMVNVRRRTNYFQFQYPRLVNSSGTASNQRIEIYDIWRLT